MADDERPDEGAQDDAARASDDEASSPEGAPTAGEGSGAPGAGGPGSEAPPPAGEAGAGSDVPRPDGSGAASDAPVPAPGADDDAEAAPPVEELSADDEATTAGELVSAVRSRRSALDAMPDGPRPQTPGETYKRRQMVVEWQLQLSYVGTYLTVAALLLVGFAAMNYTFAAFYRRALTIQQHRAFGESPDFFLLASLNVILLIVLAIGMAVYAIVQSHRIAGPVFRFRRALRAMTGRDYDFFLQLRKADYLKDVAEQLNELNHTLKAKDVVVSDALLALDDVCRRRPELAEELEPIVGTLADVVLPPDDEPAA